MKLVNSDNEEIENIEDEGIYGSDIDSDYEAFDQNCYIHIHCLCLFSYKDLNQILENIFQLSRNDKTLETLIIFIQNPMIFTP